MTKLPEPPRVAELRRTGPETVVLPAGTRLYRIYPRGGTHPAGWGRLRHYGPVGTALFDHHSEPARVQERGVLYAVSGSDAIATRVTQAFQEEQARRHASRRPLARLLRLDRGRAPAGPHRQMADESRRLGQRHLWFAPEVPALVEGRVRGLPVPLGPPLRLLNERGRQPAVALYE